MHLVLALPYPIDQILYHEQQRVFVQDAFQLTAYITQQWAVSSVCEDENI